MSHNNHLASRCIKYLDVVVSAASEMQSSLRTLAVRFPANTDLLPAIQQLLAEHNIQAACILTCVGSLTSAVLRYANMNEPTTLRGHFEIVSLVGTLDSKGGHLHLSIADNTGRTIGGHMMPLGNLVYTTVELVIGVLEQIQFTRGPVPDSQWDELIIQKTS